MIKLTPEKAPYYENVEQTKTYRALLNQEAANAPLVTQLKNTLGNIIWTRDSAGIYTGTLTGAFLQTKTYVQITNNYGDATIIPSIYRNNDNTIKIKTMVSGTPTDDQLVDTPIEITTY